MISFSSSWNREQACLARSESCRKVRESTTLLMEHRSSTLSEPSSFGIGNLHSNWGSTILLANGILINRKNYPKSPLKTHKKYPRKKCRSSGGLPSLVPSSPQSKVPRVSFRPSILFVAEILLRPFSRRVAQPACI